METCWSPGVQLGFEYDIRVKKQILYFSSIYLLAGYIFSQMEL